ncbi:MAG TPA: M28 family peptidase [Gemmatimonadales bacterium]|nr:M28 family peptidase [Gemmatimonadales bacterium]
MTDLRALLAELAVPRLTGSPGHARVRDILRRELEARGYVAMEHRFRARAADAVTLIGVRPRTRITTWLVAHSDAKGQPLSMLARLGAAALIPLGLLGLWFSLWAGLAAVAGAGLLALNRITDRSPGAVDNATGLLTVLATMDQLPADAPVGVIFTDAEELGLLGARALVRERPQLLAGTTVINFDGIDDRGAVRVLRHRTGPVGQAIAQALGTKARAFFPVIVDGRVLAHGAAECFTIMKGDWRTAAVVHRPSDQPERLSLEGVSQVAAAVARVLSEQGC